jgi:hypothetical protein
MKGRRVLQAAGFVVSAAAAVLVLITGMQYLGELSSDGQGYAGRAYRDSPLIKRTKSIQSDITVYTNVRLPIVLYTGRMVYLTPLKVNNSSQRENERYDTEMKSMAADIRDSSAVLVYFKQGAGWYVQPTLDEIRRYVPLRCIAREEDGGLYEALRDTVEQRSEEQEPGVTTRTSNGLHR